MNKQRAVKILLDRLENPPVRIEDGYVLFRVNDHFDYDISLEQLKTPDQIFDWIDHLAPKNWVTTAMIRDFVALVRDKIQLGD